MRPSPKSEMMLYHEGEWELEAHTRSSYSTHGYFESWRDEFLTPSQCWDSEISCFAHWCWSKPNVNYLENHHISVMNFTRLFWSRKSENFQLHPKHFFEQYCLYEVLRFKKICKSEQSSMVYSRDLDSPKWSKSVSKSRVLCRAPMGPIIYLYFSGRDIHDEARIRAFQTT